MRVDVSKFEEVQALANAVYEKYSSVDILCNNAGVTFALSGLIGIVLWRTGAG